MSCTAFVRDCVLLRQPNVLKSTVVQQFSEHVATPPERGGEGLDGAGTAV
jgi:hypothetical protein